MNCIKMASEHMVNISINHRGMDYCLEVDEETGNILTNNPDEAEKYMQKVLQLEQYTTRTVEYQPETNEETSSNSSRQSNIVWTTKRPSAEDNEATGVFLELRMKYADLFNNKKHVKNQLWCKIAKEMGKYGYNIGEGKGAIEKLRQKFANLQKQYINHVKHMKQTGEAKKESPPFFKEMHAILGEKDKINPKKLQDTLDDPNENEAMTSEVKTHDEKNSIKNRFSSRKCLKPCSTNIQIMQLLKEQHEEDREQRDKQFRKMEELLIVQNEQRNRMLNQFERLIDQNTRKRKYSSSEDS